MMSRAQKNESDTTPAKSCERRTVMQLSQLPPTQSNQVTHVFFLLLDRRSNWQERKVVGTLSE